MMYVILRRNGPANLQLQHWSSTSASSTPWPAPTLSLFGTKIAKSSKRTERVRPAAHGIPCSISAHFPKAWPLHHPESLLVTAENGEGFWWPTGIFEWRPQGAWEHGRRYWEAGRGALCCGAVISPLTVRDSGSLRARVRCPPEKHSQADPKESQPGLFHLQKRGSESRQEHSNFTRRPPTRRNGGLCKITLAEGSEEWQVDWQDYLSNFRPARWYYLENNK